MQEPKFPVQVYTYSKDTIYHGSDYYDLTEAELEKKCCIHGCCLYWSESIPKEVLPEAERYPNLYDIWNYECTPWWEWPDDLKEKLYKQAPKARR